MNPNRFMPKASMPWSTFQLSHKESVRKAIIILCGLLCLAANKISAQCDLDCISQVHLSLDENCMATILPETVGATSTADMTLVLYDANGVIVPNNEVDLTHAGQNLEYHINRTCGNSCWGNILIEYKLAPKIQCPPDLTLSCGGLDAMGLPPATSQCGGGTFEVFLLDEKRTQLDCDPDYTFIVERTYRAINSFGNSVDCSHTVTVLRVDLPSIYFPENATVSCGDPNHVFEAGIPIPWIVGSPLTGSGAGMIPAPGVPELCDASITNGLVCPTTGSGSSGVPLIPSGGASNVTVDGTINMPGTGELLCNSAILFTDIPVSDGACRKTIIRQWEVREWWCSGETSTGGMQKIEVIDDVPPVFVCPTAITVQMTDAFTNGAGDCLGTINLPPIDVVDDCGNSVDVQISSGVGLIQSNGGDLVVGVGPQMVRYTATDECGNASSCEVNITVNDNSEPVAICEQQTVIALSNGGTSIITADALDDGSWDECGIKDFQVRRMSSTCDADDLNFGDDVAFCCADAGTEVMVVFRVEDLSGNTNECMVRVNVQDLVNPVLTCPADQVIDCRDTYDVTDLTTSFGHPSQVDNCATTENVREIPNIDIDQCGIGSIQRIFQLISPINGAVVQSCIQTITIGNNNPFTEAHITWPAHYENLNACTNTNISPNALPAGFDVPTYTNDDECSLLGIDYSDEIIPSTAQGECLFIERTWTVINWCSSNNGSFDRFTIPSPQIIRLASSRAPVITPADDVMLETLSVDCQSQPVSITRDGRTPGCNTPLSWSYLVTSIPDGAEVATGNTNTFSGVLSTGEYNISWRAENGCGNFTFASQALTIQSNKAPTPVCLNNMTADIDNATMEIELWASDFDGGSFHTCDNAIAVSFSQDVNDTNVFYSCNDLGEQTVELWVTDLVTGAQDFCLTSINVEDNGACSTLLNNLNVGGEVVTENFESVENVEVYLDNTSLMSMTSVEGEYSFPNMPSGGSYDILPKKNTEPLNGVSTLDLVLIQRHILGQELLDSPYKLIAADADNSQSITALDLLHLRRLILGIDENLQFNTSWRFVDSEYQFIDELNPWLFDFPENYEIPSLQSDMNIDFIGVKIGDVNGSVISNLNSIALGERSSRWPLVFNVEYEAEGNFKKAVISAKNYERITGWQTTFAFDPSEIEVLGIEGMGIEINEANYTMTFLEDGLIPMSYNTIMESDIQNGEVLFEIIYKERVHINSQTPFSLNSDLVNTEAYRGIHEIVNIELDNVKGTFAKIISAKPNPWINNTTLEYIMPANGQVEWQFYDVNGRLLLSKEQQAQKGLNYMMVEKEELSNVSGVVVAKLITAQGSLEYKMMIIN